MKGDLLNGTNSFFFFGFLCFFLGVFLCIIVMCLMNASSTSEDDYNKDKNNKSIEYTGNFDDNPREDNNSFND